MMKNTIRTGMLGEGSNMIKCQDSAIKYFIDITLQGKALVIKSFNKSRHKIIKTQEGELLYCVYKREFYNTFSKEFEHLGELFPSYKEDKGESINRDAITEAQRNNCEKIVFIHPDKIYWQYTNLFLNFAVNHHLIRIQDKANEYLFKDGIRKQVKEITFSIPSKLLEVYAEVRV
jgi:hypothetical protein